MADLLDRITINPNQCGGRPCIRGMRVRVTDVLDLLAVGQSQEEILEAYPYLEPDDIAACLRYAVRRLDHQLVRSGDRLVARPQATEGERAQIDVARLIEEERDRWPG
jgi:uncharacterized protein (DUF433 family)